MTGSQKVAGSIPVSSTHKIQDPDDQGLVLNGDTKNDTSIKEAPKLRDYGGNEKKRWFIDYLDRDGQKQRLWIPSKPLNQRRREAEKQLSKIQKEFYPDLSCNLFGRLENIILSVRGNNQKTKQSYISDLKMFESFLVGRGVMVVDQIAPETIDSFVNYLHSEYADTTVKNKIRNIKHVLKLGIEKGIVKDQLFDGYKTKPNLKDSDFHCPYNDFEIRQLESYLKENDLRLWLFVRFVYLTFSRPSELLKMKVGDIDIRLRTIKMKVKPGRNVVKPIVKPLLDLILDHGLLNYPSHFYIFGQNLNCGEKKSGHNAPGNRHREALKALNLYREHETTLYGWKHTGNINAYRAGLDIRLIQEMNAHTSLETTEIYLRRLGIFLRKEAFDIDF